MTDDVVTEPSQEQSKDMDQGNRKRSAGKDAEEELTKKRKFDNANAQLPEAVGGEQAHSGQRSDDVEEIDGSLHQNAAEQAERPVDNNDAAISEGADFAEATAPTADTACPPAEQQQQLQEDPAVASADEPVTAAADAGAAVADASNPSGPPSQPSKQYNDVKEALSNRIEAPPAQIPTPAFTGFTDYLGEGIKTRLLSLATLHLTESGASHCPDAVRQLNANSNRILLGAAPNCELYQERVIRALAHQVGARFLVADSSVLGFDDLPASSKFSADAEHGAGPGGLAGDGSGMIINLTTSRDDGGLGYNSSDFEDEDDEEEDVKLAAIFRKSARKRMDSRNLRKNHHQQEMLTQLDASQKRIEAERKRVGAETKKITSEVEEKKSKAVDEKLEVVEVVEKEIEVVDKEESEEKKEEEKPAAAVDEAAAAADGAAPSSSAPLSDTADDPAVKSKESEYIENIKSMIELTKESQKRYEEMLEALKEAEAAGKSLTSSDLQGYSPGGFKMPLQKPTDSIPPGVKPFATRSTRGRVVGGRGGGDAGKRMRGTMDDVLGGLAALRKDLSPEDAAAAAAAVAAALEKTRKDPSSSPTASSFKQGDRVCYSGVYMPPLMSPSEERERAAGNSLSAYLSGSWLERREAAKRKVAASKAAAAAAAAAAEIAAVDAAATEDGTTPPLSSFGRVISIDKDGSINIVMDYPFSAGKTFPNQPENCGFTCSASDISLVDDRDDAVDASFRALFDLITSQLDTTSDISTINKDNSAPLIVFLPNMDRMVRGNDADTFRRLKERLTTSLPARCLFIGGYCTRSLAKEKASSGPSGLMGLFGGGGSGSGGGRGGGSDPLGVGSGDDFPMPWYERFGGGGPGGGRMGRGGRGNVKGRAFAAMFPNTVELHPPHNDGAAKAWKKMLDQDIAAMREKSNRAALVKALEKCDVVCEDMEAVKVTELALSKREVEQVVGAAVAAALIDLNTTTTMVEEPIVDAEAEAIIVEDASAEEKQPAAIVEEEEQEAKKKKLTVHPDHLMTAAASIKCLRAEAAPVPERSALKDLNTDQYERQLLSEVVPPEEIAVGFNDIGALDAVKNTLHEVVILPLQRPELFTRGALTRPTKGLLLFGPPGTGKTMLAKAVASESGAHFININMSAITSKWLGEGERLVRAVFSLAHKLAPSVIFIDEIDSFLGKRGGHSNEHEALRKMKTEFLAGWDGLRTKQTDRVLVLAATNRPMDLDDAAIRRMPRRIFVPLPDANNREKILRTILKDEEVDKKIDFVELGRETDGYSGSDLKNLAIAAAYCPLRELLEVEKKRMSETTANDAGGVDKTAVELPPVRSINMADFTSAMKQVTPSTHAESASTSELQKWNEQFGEGGSRKAEPLVYYT